MLRDPDTAPWGFAVQANITYSSGHALTQSSYGPATLSLDADRRWSLNTGLGELRRQGSHFRPLAGLGIEWKKAARAITLPAEHLRSSHEPSVSQAGIRRLARNSSVDPIGGRNSLARHARWVTLGWNRRF